MAAAVVSRKRPNDAPARDDISDDDVDGDAEVIGDLAEPASHISLVAEPELTAVNEAGDEISAASHPVPP